MLHGIFRVLVIVTSKVIAKMQKTHGSCIEKLHLRCKNSDKDDKRLQKDLNVQLMACTPAGKTFVQRVAKKVTNACTHL